MIIAVDFDGTLAVTEYPIIIEPKTDIINKLIHFQKCGVTIILNTCRHGDELDYAVKFCADYGLYFDYINENTPENIAKYGDSRKIYADIYLDDHAINLDEFCNNFNIEG